MNEWIFGSGDLEATLIERALSRINAGDGVLFVDPNGTATTTILSHLPKKRTKDVLLIDPTDYLYPVGWNILSDVPKHQRPGFTTLLRDTIKAIWKYEDVSTPVMDRMVYNTIAPLLEHPTGSLLDIEPMLTDKAFRTKVLKRVSDTFLLRKWAYWETKNQRDYDALISSTENKAGEFSEDPRIRNIVGQHHSTFNLRKTLFEKKIILLRLPQSELGGKASSVGSLFLSHALSIASSRKIHMPLLICVQDCYLFDTPVLRQLLATGDRYGIDICLSNKYLAQLKPDLRASIIGNCTKRTMFQTGIEDSEYLHRTIPFDNTNDKLFELKAGKTLVFEDGLLREEDAVKPRGKGDRFKTVVEQSRRAYGRELEWVENQIGGN